MEDAMIVKKKGQERPTAQKPDEPLEYMAEEEEEEGEGLNVEKEQRKPPENIGMLSIWRRDVGAWNKGEEIFTNHRYSQFWLWATNQHLLSFQTWSRSWPTTMETTRMKENLKQTNKLSSLKFKV